MFYRLEREELERKEQMNRELEEERRKQEENRRFLSYIFVHLGTFVVIQFRETAMFWYHEFLFLSVAYLIEVY